MPIKVHPLKKLRRSIQSRLNSTRKNSPQTTQMTAFFKKRGAELITMTTL